MKKKNIAIIMEALPLISMPISYILITSKNDSSFIRLVIDITFLICIFGFVFFFIGRKIDKEDKIVRVLGILDFIPTLYVVIFYLIAIFTIGL